MNLRNKKSKRKLSSSDSELELQMLKEAAVEPNFIYESSSIETHKTGLIFDKKKN